MLVVTSECVGRFVDWRKEARLFAENEELKGKSGFQRFEKMGGFVTAPVGNGTECRPRTEFPTSIWGPVEIEVLGFTCLPSWLPVIFPLWYTTAWGWFCVF